MRWEEKIYFNAFGFYIIHLRFHKQIYINLHSFLLEINYLYKCIFQYVVSCFCGNTIVLQDNCTFTLNFTLIYMLKKVCSLANCFFVNFNKKS